MTILCDICGYVGAGFLIYVAIQALLWVKLHFLSSVNMKRYKKAGDWAVVTGASDGIGKAFSLELARQGFNVMLVSRTQRKLEEVAAEIEKKNVKTKCYAFDFSTATQADYRKLSAAVAELQVGVLVNNVGINYDHPMYYEDVDVAEDLSILKVNCESQIQMTKMVVAQMKAKKAGAIISLGSYSAIADAGLLCTYAATKSFNMGFSRAMSTELSRHGIHCLAVTPGMVISAMSKMKREKFDVVAPGPFVRQSLAKLGSVTQTSGHWQHNVIETITTWLPTSQVQKMVLGAMIATKKKAEKKAAQSK